ncbi:MAG: MFS transporter [Magnetococcales bacterium]|nr:MFS transporter [Magnetococcales bacterium]
MTGKVSSALFAHAAFRIFWYGRILGNVATFMQGVTIAWLVYASARRTLDEAESMYLVGLLGLAQFLPMFLLALVAGAVADRHERRRILMGCTLAQLACAVGFTLVSAQAEPSIPVIFLLAVLFGAARAFEMPARMALTPALVPREILPTAIAWNTFGVQGGIILGPWLGGVLCAISPTLACSTALGLYLLSLAAMVRLLTLAIDAQPVHGDVPRLVMIREGLVHLWGSRVVLGAISLDLFAVLLGGVTALLPAYARDILEIGPEGLGLLRTMVGVGGGGMTLWLAWHPIRRHVGFWMLGGVAAYGLATLWFACSREMWVSMAALICIGATDSVSVYVRQNLVQILTPDPMRGRVSAVSGLFISASNELGEFESGMAARYLGVVGSALFGGVGALVVTGLWARLFPELRKVDRLLPAA